VTWAASTPTRHALARYRFDVPKHQGISYFAFNMLQTVSTCARSRDDRPAPLNEVFITEPGE